MRSASADPAHSGQVTSPSTLYKRAAATIIHDVTGPLDRLTPLTAKTPRDSGRKRGARIQRAEIPVRTQQSGAMMARVVQFMVAAVA
jgi:hypothetical protein